MLETPTEREPPGWRVHCLTIKEAAECLRVHHTTVRNLIKSGELKGYKQREFNRWKWMVPMWSIYDMQKARADKAYQALIDLAT